MTACPNKDFSLTEALERDKQLINERLDSYLALRYPETLWESMRYTTLLGGKRLRAVLLLESARVCGGSEELALPTACALEMLHAQSLIHDDLPCMDNDDFRRGKPANHRVYGEAVATLAGDALIAYAPQVIIENAPPSAPKEVILEVVREYLDAAGAMGIVGGQVVDIQSENREISPETFNYILTYKTGKLFRFAMRAGALLAGADRSKLNALTAYGEKTGFAFQIADDILDVVGTLEEIGKTPGKDLKSGKNTYVSFYGLEKSCEDLENLISSALRVLGENNIESPLLVGIAGYIKDKVVKCLKTQELK
jgi:geranylgeranyl diphosphate synthase type II